MFFRILLFLLLSCLIPQTALSQELEFAITPCEINAFTFPIYARKGKYINSHSFIATAWGETVAVLALEELPSEGIPLKLELYYGLVLNLRFVTAKHSSDKFNCKSKLEDASENYYSIWPTFKLHRLEFDDANYLIDLQKNLDRVAIKSQKRAETLLVKACGGIDDEQRDKLSTMSKVTVEPYLNESKFIDETPVGVYNDTRDVLRRTELGKLDYFLVKRDDHHEHSNSSSDGFILPGKCSGLSKDESYKQFYKNSNNFSPETGEYVGPNPAEFATEEVRRLALMSEYEVKQVKPMRMVVKETSLRNTKRMPWLKR